MHVNRKRIHPALIGDRIEAARDRGAGRMHQNVEPAELPDHLVDTPAARSGIGNVGFQGLLQKYISLLLQPSIRDSPANSNRRSSGTPW
jgi:hypothetical protein